MEQTVVPASVQTDQLFSYLDMKKLIDSYQSNWPIAVRCASEMDLDSVVFATKRGRWATAQFYLHKAIGEALYALPPDCVVESLRATNAAAKDAWGGVGVGSDHTAAQLFVARVDQCLGVLTRIKAESARFLIENTA